MARLQDQAEGGFIPTPRVVVAAIARQLQLAPTANAYFPFRLLDPAIGTGAVALLVEDLIAVADQPLRWHRRDGDRDGGWSYNTGRTGVDLYGVEIQSERAEQARGACCPKGLLVADFCDTFIEPGVFSAVFANPPYGLEVKTSGPTRRLETRFLERVTPKLTGEGLLIWIVPQEQLRCDATLLASWYTDLRCWRFPDDPWLDDDAPESVRGQPMYAAYEQVVLIAQRRWSAVPPAAADVAQIVAYADAGSALPRLPATCARGSRMVVPTARVNSIDFAARVFNPRQIGTQVSLAGRGVWGEATIGRNASRVPPRSTCCIGPSCRPWLGNWRRSRRSVSWMARNSWGTMARPLSSRAIVRNAPLRSSRRMRMARRRRRSPNVSRWRLFYVDHARGDWYQIHWGEEVASSAGWPCQAVPWETFLANYGPALTATVARKCPSRYEPGCMDWIPPPAMRVRASACKTSSPRQ